MNLQSSLSVERKRREPVSQTGEEGSGAEVPLSLLSNCSKLNIKMDFEVAGFRDASYSRDLEASLSICKLILLTYLIFTLLYNK